MTNLVRSSHKIPRLIGSVNFFYTGDAKINLSAPADYVVYGIVVEIYGIVVEIIKIYDINPPMSIYSNYKTRQISLCEKLDILKKDSDP